SPRSVHFIENGSLMLWELAQVEAGEPPLAGHRAAVRRLAVSPAGDALAAGADDGNVRVWAGGKAESTLYADHTRPVTGLAFHPEGKGFASAAADGVKLWALGDAQPRHTLAAGGHEPKAVAYRPDGKRLVSAGRD